VRHGEGITHEAAAAVPGHEDPVLVDTEFLQELVDEFGEEDRVGRGLAGPAAFPGRGLAERFGEDGDEVVLVGERPPAVVVMGGDLGAAATTMQHDHQGEQLLLVGLVALRQVQEVMAFDLARLDRALMKTRLLGRGHRGDQGDQKERQQGRSQRVRAKRRGRQHGASPVDPCATERHPAAVTSRGAPRDAGSSQSSPFQYL
jgi:hypothetical protein